MSFSASNRLRKATMGAAGVVFVGCGAAAGTVVLTEPSDPPESSAEVVEVAAVTDETVRALPGGDAVDAAQAEATTSGVNSFLPDARFGAHTIVDFAPIPPETTVVR